jgi:hypothetical protein
MSYQKDRDEFIGVIVEEIAKRKGGQLHQGGVGIAVALARLILRNAATIQRIAVDQCNDPSTPTQDKAKSAARRRISEACKPWGIKPNFQGDPRGAVVKLILPSGRWNSFGGQEDGYCVPTR